jgi:hypothetical protein
LAELSANPDAFEFNWHLIQFVFNLPDPRAFPSFAQAISDDSLVVLRRYSAAAKDLAESAFLAHSTSVTVHVHDDGMGEEVEKSFPPKENVRGFSVLFRQFYANDEAASFKAVQGRLWELNKRADDELAEPRGEWLRAWGKAVGKLRGYSLKLLVGMQLQAQGRLPPGPRPNEHLPGPEMLISVYNYGEDIHWGEKRSQVAAWNESPFDSVWMRMACFEAMAGLAYVYLGFAQLVDAVTAAHDAACS